MLRCGQRILGAQVQAGAGAAAGRGVLTQDRAGEGRAVGPGLFDVDEREGTHPTRARRPARGPRRAHARAATRCRPAASRTRFASAATKASSRPRAAVDDARPTSRSRDRRRPLSPTLTVPRWAGARTGVFRSPVRSRRRLTTVAPHGSPLEGPFGIHSGAVCSCPGQAGSRVEPGNRPGRWPRRPCGLKGTAWQPASPHARLLLD